MSSSSFSWGACWARRCVCWITNTMITVMPEQTVPNATCRSASKPLRTSSTQTATTATATMTAAAGRVVRDSQRKLKTLITELAKRKTQAVLLACTELVFAVDVRANVIPVYDTTAMHARAAVDWMLAEGEAARAAA